MTKINIKNDKSLEFQEVDLGEFFIFEGLLYVKKSEGTAFCIKNIYICPFDRDVQIRLVKSIDVKLA